MLTTMTKVNHKRHECFGNHRDPLPQAHPRHMPEVQTAHAREAGRHCLATRAAWKNL